MENDLISRSRAQDELHKLGGTGAPSGTWEDGWDKAIKAAMSALQYVPVADRDTPEKVLYAVGRGALCPCCDTVLDLTINFTFWVFIHPHLLSNTSSSVVHCLMVHKRSAWGVDNRLVKVKEE